MGSLVFSKHAFAHLLSLGVVGASWSVRRERADGMKAANRPIKMSEYGNVGIAAWRILGAACGDPPRCGTKIIR